MGMWLHWSYISPRQHFIYFKSKIRKRPYSLYQTTLIFQFISDFIHFVTSLYTTEFLIDTHPYPFLKTSYENKWINKSIFKESNLRFKKL